MLEIGPESLEIGPELSDFDCLTEIIGADKLRPLPAGKQKQEQKLKPKSHRTNKKSFFPSQNLAEVDDGCHSPALQHSRQPKLEIRLSSGESTQDQLNHLRMTWFRPFNLNVLGPIL